jgi:hypothetical protein
MYTNTHNTKKKCKTRKRKRKTPMQEIFLYPRNQKQETRKIPYPIHHV